MELHSSARSDDVTKIVGINSQRGYQDDTDQDGCHVTDAFSTKNVSESQPAVQNVGGHASSCMLKFRKLVAFVISCIAKFVTGAVFVFFVYQDAIKQTFHYSQKEVEVLAAAMNVGMGFSFLPGMFFDRFGPRKTSALGLIISTGSYLLVWSTTHSVDFYRDKSWLMSIYFLFTGLGPSFTMMVALNTNVINFDRKHTGKVVGTLNAFFAGSPSAFATIYYNLFTKGDERKSENQDYQGFMLMMAITFCAINLLDFVLVYRIIVPSPRPSNAVDQSNYESRTEQDESINRFENEYNDEDVGREDEEASIPFIKLLLNADYVLLLIIFSGASAVSLVFGVNITTVSKSVGLDHHNKWLTIISPITNAVFSISIGFFSDHFKRRIPRLQIIIGGCLAFALCTLLVVAFPTSTVALASACFFCGVGIAFDYSMTPTLLKEMFGIRNFGRNWGVALLIFSALGMPSQILFGAMYDAQITEQGRRDCFGSECIVGGMAVFLGVSILTILLGILMLNLNKVRRHLYQKPELQQPTASQP